ncbi:enoyl-CoA hydratase/isomerase family protein [Sporosarcina sp. HYO08]|uniref:enoyl-CoA hydratase/isomerase family protein n=1 Tax=Sporosarcina sp. HYO08 TaxID=1759557 RepID=UPI0007933CBE|nr:enoyl-CoA hydratase/isomerase family protein [Sporosarcina sp. HYO08]KXH79886.1 enoyl-CoA hydratase [Sporosarcina sp. HYO08]
MAYRIQIENDVAKFTIDRPEVRNAINGEVMEGLERFLEQVENNPSIAYTVITGAGDRAFCSGGDLSEFHRLRTADEAVPMLSKMAGLLYRLATLPMPVIALVNGAAVGGGCEIAIACDYRIVSSTVKAGFVQGTLAITTGWGGATLLFEKDGKHDRVFRMLSEAEVLNAEQLLEVGWATEIFEGDANEGLEQFLAKMVKIHPSVHRAYKTIALRKWTADFMRDRMLEEARQCSLLWESKAHHDAVDLFLSGK